MKRIGYILIVCCALSLALVSCNDEEINDNGKKTKIPLSDKKINFGHSDTIDKNYPKGILINYANFRKFSVFAYHSQNILSSTSSMTTYIDNLSVKGNTNYIYSWWYKGCYYWPLSGYVHFYGVATHDSVSTLAQQGITNWTHPQQGYPSFDFEMNQDTAKIKDLIIAKSINKTKDNTTGRVFMDFKHILTKINFKFKGNNMLTGYWIRVIELEYKTKGKYTFNDSTGTWTNLSNGTIKNIWQGSIGLRSESWYPYYPEGYDIPFDFFIIPQSNIKVTFHYNQGGTIFSHPINKTHTIDISPTKIGGNICYNILLPR